MRKLAFGMSGFTLLAGVCGYFLRERELRTVFDPVTGLAERWAPISIALAAVAAALALGLFLFTLKTGKALPDGEYKDAFSPNTVGPTLFLMLLGIVFAGSFAYQTVAIFPVPGMADLLCCVLGVASGVSIAVLAYNAYRGRSGSETCLCSLVPVLFLCLRLILLYRERAADPVLLDYVYEFLAVCAAILAFYYAAGYAFERRQVKRTAFFGYLAAGLCAVSIADADGIAQIIAMGCLAAALLVNSHLFAGNLKSGR